MSDGLRMASVSGVGMVSPVASVMGDTGWMTGGEGTVSTTCDLAGLKGCEGGGIACFALAML